MSTTGKFLGYWDERHGENYRPVHVDRLTDFTASVVSVALKGAGQFALSLFASTAAEDKLSPGVASGRDELFLLTEHQVTPLMKKAERDPVVRRPRSIATCSIFQKPGIRPCPHSRRCG